MAELEESTVKVCQIAFWVISICPNNIVRWLEKVSLLTVIRKTIEMVKMIIALRKKTALNFPGEFCIKVNV